MDQALANTLTELTCDFYSRVAESFSSTRQAPWDGWERVLELCQSESMTSMDVLDLASGNLRFERFLEAHGCLRSVTSVDNCDGFSKDVLQAEHTHLTIDLARSLPLRFDTSFDLSVSFAFMHHLPMPEQRKYLIQTLVDATRPKGLVALSFWQFSKSERLLGLARARTKEACSRMDLSGLCEGDYLMGWQNRQDVYRYCHDFSDQEITELAASVQGAHEYARFTSDGDSELNCYLLLQKGPS